MASKWRITDKTAVLRSGTEEEQRVVRAVLRWLEIRATEMPKEYGADWIASLNADAWHSALLRRLLDGKEPTEERPPILHSYPVYPDQCPTGHEMYQRIECDVFSVIGYKCTGCGAMKWEDVDGED